jgi:hypothetical protein
VKKKLLKNFILVMRERKKSLNLMIHIRPLPGKMYRLQSQNASDAGNKNKKKDLRRRMPQNRKLLKS